MNKTGPIIIIEDDLDDQSLLKDIFHSLDYNNDITFFTDGNKALEYLNRTDVQPFLILSDINMPLIDGFQLRKKIFTNDQLQSKCIPYLFFTTGANRKAVTEAYAMSVQGFFLKPMTEAGLKNTIRKIVEYWQECIAPGEYE
ncbi:MAG: response regulator [Chitinophagaceae bacterium]|jgi:CheY-like chemotaxis protein|nr:response regulator [Chitinophagaceae bacterium]